MKNISWTPLDRARHELETVNLQLMWVIEHAHRWHDIKKAADSMFHARLIWEGTYRELTEQRTESGSVGGNSAALMPATKEKT